MTGPFRAEQTPPEPEPRTWWNIKDSDGRIVAFIQTDLPAESQHFLAALFSASWELRHAAEAALILMDALEEDIGGPGSFKRLNWAAHEKASTLLSDAISKASTRLAQ